VIKTIQSRLFWFALADLEEIITPIVEAQVEAQTDRSHLGYVKGRWDKIWQHLRDCEKRCPSVFTASFWQTLEARKKRQLSELHSLAHWLQPETVINSRFEPG
jgi:hypothetical protein